MGSQPCLKKGMLTMTVILNENAPSNVLCYAEKWQTPLPEPIHF